MKFQKVENSLAERLTAPNSMFLELTNNVNNIMLSGNSLTSLQETKHQRRSNEQVSTTYNQFIKASGGK